MVSVGEPTVNLTALELFEGANDSRGGAVHDSGIRQRASPANPFQALAHLSPQEERLSCVSGNVDLRVHRCTMSTETSQPV